MKNYPGNKFAGSLYKKIINEIPRCDVFRELFAGSAAVTTHLTAPDLTHINELSEKVYQELRFEFPESIVTNDCAISIINKLPGTTDRTECIHLDPPYRLHTRHSSMQMLYDHEMTDEQHEQLLSAVLAKEKSYLFIIIHPYDEMYNTRLAHWRQVKIKVRYRNKTSIEVLYMNYQSPDVLQDYRHLGKGNHDRQRIKRKGDRMIAKLLALPAVEKNYILERLKQIQ